MTKQGVLLFQFQSDLHRAEAPRIGLPKTADGLIVTKTMFAAACDVTEPTCPWHGHQQLVLGAGWVFRGAFGSQGLLCTHWLRYEQLWSCLMWTWDLRQEVRKSPLHLQPRFRCLFLFFSCRLFNFHAGWIANTHLFWAYLKTTGSAVVAMAALSGELDKLNICLPEEEKRFFLISLVRLFLWSLTFSDLCPPSCSSSVAMVTRCPRLSQRSARSFVFCPLTGRRPFINLFPRDVTNPDC